MIADIAGKRVEMRHDVSKPQGVRSRSADLTLVKNLLGWEPIYSLRDTMEELYSWVTSEVNKNQLVTR